MLTLDRDKFNQIVTTLKEMDPQDDRYFSYANLVWTGMSQTQRDQLNQILHRGPVYSGSVLSKVARDDLIDYGLVTPCCFMGEQGYYVATYMGYTVFNSANEKAFSVKPGTPA